VPILRAKSDRRCPPDLGSASSSPCRRDNDIFYDRIAIRRFFVENHAIRQPPATQILRNKKTRSTITRINFMSSVRRTTRPHPPFLNLSRLATLSWTSPVVLLA